MPTFSYDRAFTRNIGWVTAAEQHVLRARRIAIAGLGGVGGSHLLTLARLGVGAFNVADFDTFGLENFNRQVGATMKSLDRPKCDVLVEMAMEINPELDIRVFKDGIADANVETFLEGADVFVDGLDYFAIAARRAVFAACHRQGIPAITAAPLGMGAALLTFVSGSMTFEEYFRLDECADEEQSIRFLLGLSPRLLQRSYLADPSAVDLEARRGPSTVIACQLCAGLAATEALKIMLGRGKVRGAPHGLHFDAYRNRLVHTWRPLGNANPLQRLMIRLAKRDLARMRATRDAS